MADDSPSEVEHSSLHRLLETLGHWFRTQPGAVITLTTGVASMTGAVVAHRYYSNFEVRPLDVGFGPFDYALCAAVVLFCALAISLAALGIGLALAEIDHKLVGRKQHLLMWLATFVVFGCLTWWLYRWADAWLTGTITLTFIGVCRLEFENRREERRAGTRFDPNMAAVLAAGGTLIVSRTIGRQRGRSNERPESRRHQDADRDDPERCRSYVGSARYGRVAARRT